MRLHGYRNAWWWVRAVGLCPFSDLPDQPTLRALAIASGLAVDDRFPTHGDNMICDTTSRLTLISGPASEPLSVAEAKLFLRIEHSADDALIAQCITAAREAAEQHLRIAMLPQTYAFSTGILSSIVALPIGPAQAVTEILALDATGESDPVNANSYRLTIDGFSVVFTAVPPGKSITVRYTANLAATAAAVPAPLKQGMLHHLAVMLEQRDGPVPMPAQALACYQPYRRIRL